MSRLDDRFVQPCQFPGCDIPITHISHAGYGHRTVSQYVHVEEPTREAIRAAITTQSEARIGHWAIPFVVAEPTEEAGK